MKCLSEYDQSVEESQRIPFSSDKVFKSQSDLEQCCKFLETLEETKILLQEAEGSREVLNKSAKVFKTHSSPGLRSFSIKPSTSRATLSMFFNETLFSHRNANFYFGISSKSKTTLFFVSSDAGQSNISRRTSAEEQTYNKSLFIISPIAGKQ